MTELTVLITTSGTGSRLGDQTKYTNKSLLGVGDLPVIARIIESYPVDTQFVVTVGYKGDFVKQFLAIAYENRAIQIVNVDKFSGPESSLAYSMLQAKPYLEKPFIYHAGDTLVSGQPNESPTENWLGVFATGDSMLYASVDVTGRQIVKIHPKGKEKFDYLYVGLAGILDYGLFWQALEQAVADNPENQDLNDLTGVLGLMKLGRKVNFHSIESWFDVGNLIGLSSARAIHDSQLRVLEKQDEAIFRLGDSVFKFFADSQVCLSRVRRSESLSPHVPRVTSFSENWYSYQFVPGIVLSENINVDSFEHLLNWAQEAFWQKKPPEVDSKKFDAARISFYFEKTKARINDFLKRSGLEDGRSKINGVEVPSAIHMVDLLASNNLLHSRPSLMHGDFILDNIIKTDSGYVAIDWRQDFAGLLSYGDVYYDLAKLAHSLTMNHEVLSTDLFTISYSDDGIRTDIFRKEILVELEVVLRDFLDAKGYSSQTVQLLKPLVWLNMAALHSHPLNHFLFQHGKYSLWRALIPQLRGRSVEQ